MSQIKPAETQAFILRRLLEGWWLRSDESGTVITMRSPDNKRYRIVIPRTLRVLERQGWIEFTVDTDSKFGIHAPRLWKVTKLGEEAMHVRSSI